MGYDAIKNRFYWEREVLMDDLAEETRTRKLDPFKVEAIADIIFEKHDEYLKILEDEYMDIEEALSQYRYEIMKLINSDDNTLI
jgi:hypothetical protein